MITWRCTQNVYTFPSFSIKNEALQICRIYGDSFLDITDLNQLPVKLTAVIKRFLR